MWHELETPATHFAAGAYHTLYSGIELGRPRAVLPVPVVGGGPAGPLHHRVPAPRRRCGSGSARGRARSRSTRTRAARRRRRRRAPLVCGWQLHDRVVLQPWSSPPGARTAAARRLFGPPAAVDEVFGRSTAARDAAPAPRPARPRPAGSPTPRRCCSRERPFDLDVADVLRRARRRPPVLGPVAARRPTARRRHARACSAARWRTSTRASTPRSPACSPRCPTGTDVIVARRSAWTSTPAAPTCCPRCSTPSSTGGGRRRRGHRIRVDLAAAGRAADRAAGAGRARRCPDRVGARPDRRGWSCAASTGRRPARSPTRPTTRATCGSTCAAASATGSSSPARPTALMDEIATGLLHASPTRTDTPAVKSVERVAEHVRHRRALPTGCPTSSSGGATGRRRGSTGVRSRRFGTVTPPRRSAAAAPATTPTGDAWALVVPGASTPRHAVAPAPARGHRRHRRRARRRATATDLPANRCCTPATPGASSAAPARRSARAGLAAMPTAVATWATDDQRARRGAVARTRGGAGRGRSASGSGRRRVP